MSRHLGRPLPVVWPSCHGGLELLSTLHVSSTWKPSQSFDKPQLGFCTRGPCSQPADPAGTELPCQRERQTVSKERPTAAGFRRGRQGSRGRGVKAVRQRASPKPWLGWDGASDLGKAWGKAGSP